MAESEANPKSGAKAPEWEIRGTKLFAFGGETDLTELIRGSKYVTEEDAAKIEAEEGKEPEETPEKPPEEAVQEAKPEVETPPEPAKPEETPKEEAKPAEEASKEAEPVAESKLLEYVIKHRGEEKTLKLTPEQLIARLQMAEDYSVKTEELAQKRREVEPYEHILKTQAFKEWLDGQILDNPELAPKSPPPPSPEDVFAYRVRSQDADFADIRKSMHDWAISSLPEYEQNILSQNYRVFNETYDRFAKLHRDTRVRTSEPAPEPQPRRENPPVDPKVREKIIQSKEVNKVQAEVEKPGVAQAEDAAETRFNKHVKELRKILKSGSPQERNIAAAQLLQYQIESVSKT